MKRLLITMFLISGCSVVTHADIRILYDIAMINLQCDGPLKIRQASFNNELQMVSGCGKETLYKIKDGKWEQIPISEPVMSWVIERHRKEDCRDAKNSISAGRARPIPSYCDQ